jgi:hypothetical protein
MKCACRSCGMDGTQMYGHPESGGLFMLCSVHQRAWEAHPLYAEALAGVEEERRLGGGAWRETPVVVFALARKWVGQFSDSHGPAPLQPPAPGPAS